MERSESIGELVSALAKAQAEFTPAIKGTKNDFFNSKYADLAANIEAVRPALNKHGIALVQFNQSDLERQVAINTTSLHHGEQFMSITTEAPAVGQKGFSVQSLGACWTYLRRYNLQALCGLASEDDDGNSVAVPSESIPAAIKKTQTTAEERQQWSKAFEECHTLDLFNQHIVPLMKERSRDFIVATANEAKRRGWIADRATGLYAVAERKTA